MEINFTSWWKEQQSHMAKGGYEMEGIITVYFADNLIERVLIKIQQKLECWI